MKILVVGETCYDISLEGFCTRICPEAPVPILSVINPKQLLCYSEHASLGMAGNVVENLRNLGAEVQLITNETFKPFKIRYFDKASGQMMFRSDLCDKVVDAFDREQFKTMVRKEGVGAVVISDYDKGYLVEKDIRWMAMQCQDLGIPTYLDTKKPVGLWCEEVTLVKINLLEYEVSRRVSGHALEQLTNLIVTTGGDGCTWGSMRYKQKVRRDVRDVCGAGDTFLAALACMHASSTDIKKAIDFANHCAGTVVEHHGVVPVDPKEKEALQWEDNTNQTPTSQSPEEPDSLDPQSSET